MDAERESPATDGRQACARCGSHTYMFQCGVCGSAWLEPVEELPQPSSSGDPQFG